MELYLNGQSIRKDFVAPYEWGRNTQDDPALNNLQVGSYTLRAVATDNKGATAETTISFTVQRTNTAPSVAFISPLNGQSFPEGTTLTVNVNATDSDGAVANVRLFLNEQLVRQDISAPYQWGFNDALLQNLRAGTYTLRAVAMDNNGLTGETSVTINVVRVNRAPVVSFHRQLSNKSSLKAPI
ncbi:MAG: hypothetical protein HC892_10135 [Saprospiraceae bacterium]|nr:hypothetical protein [Saprospiraceae bacterium]